jgi:trk system potassium uptake protein TrkH
VIVIAILLITCNLLMQGDYRPLYHNGTWRAFTDAAFQVTSVLSTTGQYITDFNNWPTFSKMILLALMLTGACSASLGGGPKLLRIIVCLKFIRRGLAQKIHPDRISVLTLNHAELSQGTATNITNHMFLYILTIFVGSLLISINGFDLITTFSSTLSCINNNGMFFGLSGQGMNYSAFSWFSKLVFSVLMIAGRLELFTLIMLFSGHYWNPDKA